MRTLVCGGRDYSDREALFGALDAAGITHLVVGYDPTNPKFQGADQLAFEWAKARGIPGTCFPAKWSSERRAAGPKRNQRMLDRGMPERVLSAPGGRGTADMVRRATKAGIPVQRVP